MTTASRLSDLFKAIGKPRALQHWTRPGVELLSQALYWDDAMGLRGFGVPSDEYEPEAELAFALILGCSSVEELWEVAEATRAPDVSRERLLDCLDRSFLELFGEPAKVDRNVADAFLEALTHCGAS